jgi:hypothetical protein
MKRIACIAVGAALLAAPLPAARASEPTYTILGYGTASCGRWTQGRKPPQTDVLQVARQAWVLGYITSVNRLLPEGRGPVDRNLSEGTDTNGLFGWIDNYCAANPLRSLAYALDMMTGELGAKWLAAHPAARK